MSLIPTWPIAVGALVLGALGGAALDHTIMSSKIDGIEKRAAEVDRQRAEIRAADELDARTKEQTLTAQVGKVQQEKTNEIDRINSRHALELDGLRRRADRRPATSGQGAAAAPACEGSTGAELSRPDAEFLIGEAARADRQRTALGACYQAYDAVRESLK